MQKVPPSRDDSPADSYGLPSSQDSRAMFPPPSSICAPIAAKEPRARSRSYPKTGKRLPRDELLCSISKLPGGSRSSETRCHRAIPAAASPVFKAMPSQKFKEQRKCVSFEEAQGEVRELAHRAAHDPEAMAQATEQALRCD